MGEKRIRKREDLVKIRSFVKDCLQIRGSTVVARIVPVDEKPLVALLLNLLRGENGSDGGMPYCSVLGRGAGFSAELGGTPREDSKEKSGKRKSRPQNEACGKSIGTRQTDM